MKLNDTSALIVSSDPVFADQIEGFLEFGKLCLIHKTTATEDIYPAMRKSPIDFVIINDAPPDLDGIKLTRRIRTDQACPNNKVNIFVITAVNGTIKRSIEGVNAGAHEVISKPFGADRILSRLHANIVEPVSFIKSQKYVGPDRRRSRAENGSGPGRRAGDS